MVLPAGIITATLDFGGYLDDQGAPYDGRVVFSSDTHRVWTETGDVIGPFTHAVPLLAGSGSVELPVVDQPGYVDGYGNADPATVYTASIERTGRAPQLITFALMSGGLPDQVYDLDLMPPVSAPPDPVVNASLAAVFDAAADAAGWAADAQLAASDADASVVAATTAATTATAAAEVSQDAAAASASSASAAAATAAAVPRWWAGTQVAYDAIVTKDPATLYIITG